MSYKQLLVAFARSGVLGYGGGPSVIPLIRYEAVENYKWMNDEEFGDILAMANALPGPIATKMAAYIGYRVKGIWGATVAILAHILPSVLAMVLLLSLLYKLKGSPVVKGMISAIGPVIGVMLAVMTYEFVVKSKKAMGWKNAGLLLVLALVLLEALGIHPALVIVIFVAAALGINAYKRTQGQARKERPKEWNF